MHEVINPTGKKCLIPRGKMVVQKQGILSNTSLQNSTGSVL